MRKPAAGEAISDIEGALVTARACGDVTDYASSYLYDPVSETLHADLRVALNAPAEYIIVRLGRA